jgi:hypothetical protein
MQATLTPQIKGYGCLATAMSAGGTITLGTGTISNTGVVIYSNASIPSFTARVQANIESTGTIGSTPNLTGTKTAGAATRKLPGSDVFDYYIANGTALPLSALPFKSGTKALTAGVLTSACNTIGGGVDSNGIYVIDCAGQPFTIADVRIHATVVLLNCGGLLMKNSIVWSPAISNLPCLMVQGNVSIKPDTGNLSESAQVPVVNFNPPGAPYPWPTGTSNTGTTDSFTSSMRGLVYVTGNFTFLDDTSMGVLICGGTVSCDKYAISFNYSPIYRENPPPGFYDVDMTPSSTTWVQMTN